MITLSDIAKEIAYSWWEAKEYMAKKTAVFLVRLQWFVYPSSKARMEKLLEYERRHIHWSISGKYE